jgi:hypothetical protein
MITVKPMEIQDFLTVMEANKGVQPKYDCLPGDQKRICAQYNIIMGTAKSYFEDDKLIGVFGIRNPEAWGISIPEFRVKRKCTLFRLAKNAFGNAVENIKSLKVFACPTLSKTFLEHLGFKEDGEIMTYTRSV